MGVIEMLWQEKYRPQTLDDIVGQSHIIPRLLFMIEELHQTGNDGAWPHLFFAGPPGVGKTAIAVALMRTAFGDDWKANWLELNASNDRSINTVRNQIKEFASKGVVGTYLVNGEAKPIPFNVVFLDEADALTPDAQAALRRTMERYSSKTRFILSCNYPQKIIEPLRDRCAFADARFKPVPRGDMVKALRKVVDSENINISKDALKQVVIHSKGSMRKSLNLLFTASRQLEEVEEEDVIDIVQTMSQEQKTSLLARAVEANTTQDEDDRRRMHRALDRHVEDLHANGLSGAEILDGIYEAVSNDTKMPARLQRAILMSMGEALYWCSVSSNDLLAVKTFFRRVVADE